MRYDTRGNDDTDIWKRETAMLILIHNRRRAGQGRAGQGSREVGEVERCP